MNLNLMMLSEPQELLSIQRRPPPNSPNLRADLKEVKEALELIADIAFDRDGYTGNADKLGELIDEIYRYAKNPKSAYLVAHPKLK